MWVPWSVILPPIKDVRKPFSWPSQVVAQLVLGVSGTDLAWLHVTGNSNNNGLNKIGLFSPNKSRNK